MDDSYSIYFQADVFEHGSRADVLVKEGVKLPEAIDFLNERGIECFVLGGRRMRNRISVGGGILRNNGWYESSEYAELVRAGKVVVLEA